MRRELARYEAETDFDVFELDELYRELLPTLRLEFPDNDHPRAKLRQVLQQLRDRGEVEFLGEGVYRLEALGEQAEPVASGGASPEGNGFEAREYETTTRQRAIPQAFKSAVIRQYGGRCPVSGVDHRRLLDVAHVLPWADNPERRTDLGNVLPLSKTIHAAFDNRLMTLDREFRLRVSPGFDTDCSHLQGVLHERDGDTLEFLRERPLSPAYLEEQNSDLDWL